MSELESELRGWIGLIDTSAAYALFNAKDDMHGLAKDFFESSELEWRVLNSTTHESFTRTRYDISFDVGLNVYREFRKNYEVLNFTGQDEDAAEQLLVKYKDKQLSFHDALCAAVMRRHGIYKIFTFDSDFWAFSFEVMPGRTRQKNF